MVDKLMILLVEAKPHIYTQYYRIRRNVRDSYESLESPLGDSQRFPNVPKTLYDSL